LAIASPTYAANPALTNLEKVMIQRELRTAEEIAAWITDELQKTEDCKGCRVDSVVGLREPDTEGCNWSDSIAVQLGNDYSRPIFQKIIQEARLRFNLKI
jgi:hypothetical protein